MPFVSLANITEFFEGENKQIRRGENAVDSHHVEPAVISFSCSDEAHYGKSRCQYEKQVVPGAGEGEHQKKSVISVFLHRN